MFGFRKRPGNAMSMEQAYELHEAGQGLLLDVRTPTEYERGHLPGALNWPLDELERGIFPAALSDRAQTLLLYCHSGVRARLGAALLEGAGFTRVYHVGGIADWRYEIERGREVGVR
ncbi:MAG: rhodanese-like domain-containing protein [Eubacteriales bacterium]